MHADGTGGPLALALGRAGGESSTAGECVEGQGAGAVVFCCDVLEHREGFGVAAFADEKFGGFFETDYEDTCHAHYEDECAGGVPDIAPALVVGLCAGSGIGEVCGILAGVVWEKSPGEETGDELTDT